MTKIYINSSLKESGDGTSDKPFNNLMDAFEGVRGKFEQIGYVKINSHQKAIRGHIGVDVWEIIKEAQESNDTVYFYLHTNYPNFLNALFTSCEASNKTDWEVMK